MDTKRNTPETVAAVVRSLAAAGQETALFGGWAEEALQMVEPRPHRDIDLLLLADDLSAVDKCFRTGALRNEVAGKRFHHKRAFLFGGVLVELYLARRDGHGWVTDFWGEIAYPWLWPLYLSGQLGGQDLRITTAKNLTALRQHYRDLEPWRWREQVSLVVPSVPQSSA